MPQANLIPPLGFRPLFLHFLPLCGPKSMRIHVMQNKIAHASLLLLSALRNTTFRNSRATPETELHEIAVVFIQGGLRGALGSDQHYTTNPAQIAQPHHARA